METPGKLPESGWLDGHVRIEWFRNNKKSQALPEPEMRVELERVNFHREFSRIHAPGRVTISSAIFNASGRQLTIQYDQLRSRVAELELRHLDKLTYLSDPQDVASDPENKVASETASAKKTKKSKEGSVYRLSLVDQIVIHQGENRIEADRIEVLVSNLFSTRRAKAKPLDDKDSAASSDSEKEPPTLTTLTCSGPLRLVPVDPSEEIESPQELAVHVFGQPIRIWKAEQLSLVASTLSYYPGQEKLDLTAAADEPIRFISGSDQWASAEGGARWDRKKGLLYLQGPGEIHAQPKDSQRPFNVTYQKTLTLQLDDQNAVDWIQLDGDVQAQSEALSFRGERLVAELTHDAAGNYSPELIRMEGNARIEDANYIVEAGERLEILFDPNTQENSEQGFRSVLATGAKGSVRITDKAREICIVGNRLEGNAAQQFRIYGQRARIESLSSKSDFRAIEGDVIIVDAQQGHFEIPGQGSLEAMMPNPWNTADTNSVVPATIQWGQGAIYNLDQRRVEMKDVFVKLDEPGALVQTQTEITTPALTIILAEKAEPQSSASVENIGRLSQLIAHGPLVHMVRKQVDSQSGEPVSLMELEATRLEFDQASETLVPQGKGWLEMTDFVGDTAASQAMQSSTPLYTLVRFRDHLRYRLDQRQITLAGQVMIDQIPLVAELNFTARPQVEAMKQLTCETLRVAISRDDEGQVDSAVSKLSQSLGRLDHLSAQGNVFFETFLNGRHQTFTAQELSFEKLTQTAIFQGTPQSPVQFNQIRFSEVRFNLLTGDIDTKPVGHSEMANQF